MDKDTCEITAVDREKVRTVGGQMKPDEIVLRLSETFKVLGDPTRIKITQALAQEELCVCDIASLLGMSDSAISHQLRVLRNLRLVKYRKEGKMAFYSLDDEHITRLFECALEHVTEN
ncbi:MAG: ArsR/SmtB family transcription factor [bacterium]